MRNAAKAALGTAGPPAARRVRPAAPPFPAPRLAAPRPPVGGFS